MSATILPPEGAVKEQRPTFQDMLAAADSSKKEQPTKHISSSRQPGWKKQPLWSELKGKKAEDGKEAKHKAELEQEELPRLRQLFKFNLTTLNCSSIFFKYLGFFKRKPETQFPVPCSSRWRLFLLSLNREPICKKTKRINFIQSVKQTLTNPSPPSVV